MRFRRRLPIFVGVLLIAAAVAVVVLLRKNAPPEAARLLPAADGYVYINLKRFRRANLGSQLPAVAREAEYEKFIQATDFEFENDLDEAAFAIHYPSKQLGSSEARFSEVFVGKLKGTKLREYLQKISASVENYQSIDIFSIPLEGRTLRVAILGADTVAASNVADPLIIRSMIDRSRKLASPFGGPPLLRRHYKHVAQSRNVFYPRLAWAVFRVNPSADGPAAGPFGLSFLFSKPAVVVSSIFYSGSVRFRGEAFTDDDDEAQRVTTQLNTFFSLFHPSEGPFAQQGSGPDPDIQKLLESLQVKREGDRSVLTATIPSGFIQKVFAAPAPEPNPDSSKATPPPPTKAQKGTSK